MSKQKAFSLVELMLGLLLGTCLLTLMLRHYLIVKQGSVDIAKVLARSDDQVLISELICPSIQQAGFTPCAPIRWLTAHENKSSQGLKAIVLNVGEKQALQMSRMSEHFSVIKDLVSTNQVVVEANPEFKVGADILVADCFHAELKTIQSIKHEGSVWRIQFNTPLRYTYKPPVYMGEWLQERFFMDKNNQGENALYYQLKHPEELSSEIQGLSVQLESRGDKQLVSIDFLLKQGKTWHIETAVRV